MPTPAEIEQIKRQEIATKQRQVAYNKLAAIPPPTSNLVVPPPKASAQTAVGIVNEVANGVDGVRRAYVNVNGSTFACVVPGSVLGVMEGKSVQIRIEGNSRTVVAVVTPLDPPTYTSTPDDEVRGNTPAGPSANTPSGILWPYTSVSPRTISHVTGNAVSDINGVVDDLVAVYNRLINPIDLNLSLANVSAADIAAALDDIKDWQDDMTTAFDALTNKVDTMIQDFQEGTGILQ